MATTQNDRIRALTGTLGVKAPCVAATTANITLSGAQTIDGVSVVAEDRVLVKNQTTASDNGIYVCQTAAWIRAADFDGDRDLLQGTLVPVYGGTTNRKTIWEMTSANPTIGTDNITFVNWWAHSVQTLTDQATITWDIDSGDCATVTLAGNRTLALPTNAKAGDLYILKVVQDATGSRTLTFHASYLTPWNGSTPVLSTPASAVDLFAIWYDGTSFYVIGPQKRFA